MADKVGLVGVGIVAEARCLHDVLQQSAHVAVHVVDAQLALLHGLNDLFRLLLVARFHQVVAGSHLDGCVQILADAYPVGHHHALEAPVLAQYLRQQVVVPHRVLAVHLVIRRHHRPGLALPHGNLESAQVQFASRAGRHPLVNARAVRLLRVHGVVFRRGAHALALHAADVGCRYLARHQRVFREVFEVAAAQRVAMQVHARTQYHVAAILHRLLADGRAYALQQVCVPCCRQTRPDGEACGVEGLRGALTSGVDAHAGRSVSEHRCRYAQSWDGRRLSGCSRHAVGAVAHHGVLAEEVLGAAHEQSRLFLQRHGLQHLVDVVLTEFRRLLGHGTRAEQARSSG